jgi:hypothetical protein
MLLRDHPLMRYHGIPNWPPAWSWIDGLENKHPQGEVGILKAIQLSNVQPEKSSYMGCLLFNDAAFCQHIAELLQSCCNRPIAEIGGLDLSHTW